MKVLIIEDENAAARRLEKLLNEIAPDASVVDRIESVEGAVSWLQSHPKPDLILLDIHLADGSSFEIFQHIKVSSPVIFTTAYDEHALKAFKVNAIDYLLKPIKTHELAAAIEKYRQIFQAPAATDYSALAETMRQTSGQASQYMRRMLIRFSGSIRLVEVSDVAYFYSRDKITFVVLRSTGKRYPIEHPLDRLEQMLDPTVFFRLNRQFIISISSIREMHPYSKSRIKVTLDPAADSEALVSTERSAEFKRWLVGEQGAKNSDWEGGE